MARPPRSGYSAGMASLPFDTSFPPLPLHRRALVATALFLAFFGYCEASYLFTGSRVTLEVSKIGRAHV